MITFEEAGEMLENISETLPPEFYKDLNGGINLLPDVKEHPRNSGSPDLYILGEYRNELGLGRYINIYFGSFLKVHANISKEKQGEELKKILIHEFTHHLESLAGERDLEIKDIQDLEMYNKKRGGR